MIDYQTYSRVHSGRNVEHLSGAAMRTPSSTSAGCVVRDVWVDHVARHIIDDQVRTTHQSCLRAFSNAAHEVSRWSARQKASV